MQRLKTSMHVVRNTDTHNVEVWSVAVYLPIYFSEYITIRLRSKSVLERDWPSNPPCFTGP